MNRVFSIEHVKRAQQIKDFSSIRFGQISPTDIDGCIEYKNILYVFFELKLVGTPIKYGQRLAFERITDDLATIKPTIYIIAEHNQKDVDKFIEVDNSLVREYRDKKIWHQCNEPIKLYDFIQNYISYVEQEEV